MENSKFTYLTDFLRREKFVKTLTEDQAQHKVFKGLKKVRTTIMVFIKQEKTERKKWIKLLENCTSAEIQFKTII